MSSPNQRKVISPSERIKPKEPFFQIEWKWIEEIIQETQNPNCVILWQYFYKNAPDYICEVSSSYIRNVLQMGEKAYKAAFDRLIECKYLVRKGNSKTIFDFVPFPN